MAKGKMSTEEFCERAAKLHKNKYDYSLTVYTGMQDKIKIKCPVHGVFRVVACAHLRGNNCLKCSKDRTDDIAKGWFRAKQEPKAPA